MTPERPRTDGTASRRRPHGQRSALVEVLRHNGRGWHVETAESQAHGDRLRKKDLPVLRAEAGHEHPQHREQRPESQQRLHEARIDDGPHGHRDDEHEERLGRADPGDVRRGL